MLHSSAETIEQRQLRATGILVIISSQFSCQMLMSKFQDVIKTWGLGPPKIPPTCLMRLGRFNELPTLKSLKYKNFEATVSKHKFHSLKHRMTGNACLD